MHVKVVPHKQQIRGDKAVREPGGWAEDLYIADIIIANIDWKTLQPQHQRTHEW